MASKCVEKMDKLAQYFSKYAFYLCWRFPPVDLHALAYWTACFDDHGRVYLSKKDAVRWFPIRRRTSSDANSDHNVPMIEDGPEEDIDIVMFGHEDDHGRMVSKGVYHRSR